MSITLLRKESEEPNITNDMEIRAFKYAGTGYDGVVANYLNECGSSYSGSTLTIKSGEIIVDGWQVDISSAGESVTFNNISGTCYYTVYLEIDLSVSDNKTVEIKSTYSTTTYPSIDQGDDISVTTNGIRNFELYHVTVTDGIVTTVESCFDLIDGTVKNAEFATYASEDTSLGTIEERLTNLGFKSGSLTMASGFTASTNTITRQGNYCILKLKMVFTTTQLSSFCYSTTSYTVGNIPSEFLPKTTVNASIGIGYVDQTISGTSNNHRIKAEGFIRILTSGEVIISSSASNTTGGTTTSYGQTIYPIVIGYEATPLS